MEKLGYRLFDVEFKAERGWVLRVIIDKEGGVSIGDCEEVSKRLSPLLDVEDIIPFSYSLEVSSPGLNRELSKPEHFEFFLGRQVKVILREPIDTKRELKGKIFGIKDGVIQIQEEERLYHIPVSAIARANLHIDPWSRT
ncbi:MAG: ribosome maturation factor RimP [Aquificaceae bacterium]|nr:ribosome maturation factor RimP [Aquificaceae bacterium]MDW8236809.1 ribosome maturation factor RimP [Aquificaceae bacterium]